MKRKESRECEDKKTDKENNNPKPKKWRRILKEAICKPVLTDWLIFLVTFGIGTVGFLQYKMLHLSTQQYMNTQRAFVLYNDIQAITVGKARTKKVEKVILTTTLQNSGATPTNNLRMRINTWQNTEPMPKDFAFPENKGRHIIKGVFGPHSINSVSGIVVPIDDIVKIASGTLHYYIYGWATYNDMLGGSETHRTEFCLELANIIGDPTIVEEKAVHFDFIFCPTHNCADKECDNQ